MSQAEIEKAQRELGKTSQRLELEQSSRQSSLQEKQELLGNFYDCFSDENNPHQSSARNGEAKVRKNHEGQRKMGASAIRDAFW